MLSLRRERHTFVLRWSQADLLADLGHSSPRLRTLVSPNLVRLPALLRRPGGRCPRILSERRQRWTASDFCLDQRIAAELMLRMIDILWVLGLANHLRKRALLDLFVDRTGSNSSALRGSHST